MEWLQLVERGGVTVAVLLWFMLRAEKRLDMISSKIVELSQAIALLAKTVDGLEEQQLREKKDDKR